MPVQTFIGTDLTCGISTATRVDEDPPHLLVESLGYEGGFRGSGLRAGDRIVEVDGEPIRRLPLDQARIQLPRMPGQYEEARRWADAGRREGDTVRLVVMRKAAAQGWETVRIEGTLLLPRNYRTESNAVLIYENGPGFFERDDFNDAWSSWLDGLGARLRAILTFGRNRPGLTTQYEYKSLLQEQPRVDFLVEKYPGPFARAVQSDFQDALAAVRGRLCTLTEADLAYRTADEERVQTIAGVAEAAWRALQTAHAGETIPAFPGQHPVYGKKDDVVGRVVLLEDLTTRRWVSEAGHGYFAAGSDEDGWYFLDMEGEGAQRMLMALRRYQRLVSARIEERYSLLARILPDARVLVMNETGHWGLQVELLGAFIGGAMFVDVQGPGPSPPFAGEAALLTIHGAEPGPEASPREVLDAMIAAIKSDDPTLWKTLFADWLVRSNPDGTPQVCYLMQEPQLDDFERSRASFAGRLYDARTAWVDDVRTITTGAEYEGAPHVEEVEAEVEHIGRFDGEYRVFLDVTVHRYWTLQRVNRGPWRIATLQSV